MQNLLNEKKNYNPMDSEHYWQQFWKKNEIYKFNPENKKEIFSIDTPPPTISGALHLGHIYSYTQAEVIARFMRMYGKNVRYPMGMDNNGLPTEKLVEKEKGVRGHDTDREKFIKICLEATKEYQKQYQDLWEKLGFSIDWSLIYSTISKESQKLAQLTFKKLYDQKIIYKKSDIALYCHKCRTFIAQAEVEDEQQQSIFYDIVFKKEDGKDLIIATTRPELLPACVGVFVNPKDTRYKKIIGTIVTTALGDKVKLFTDEKVDIKKGSGAVMCCTYGDETDLYWKRKYNLKEKIIIGEDGKLIKIKGIESIFGKSLIETRKIIVEKLKSIKAIQKEEKIIHDIGVHERCKTPIELLSTKQWFLKILDKKTQLLKAGKKINWHPQYMQKRYAEWVSNLKWDWCISRDRFYGVPIPAFYCNRCDYEFVPNEKKFPIDPRVEKNMVCPKCEKGQLIGEKGVLDTWFTSSLTPDINNNHKNNGKLKGKLYPMSMRPQAHDIIRTWAVYTILMGIYNHNDIPWKDLMISGHILLRKGEKISKKTGGGKYKPEELIAQNSADAVRYAMCGAQLGKDGYFDEFEVKKGKRLINKIYNAGKLVLGNLTDFNERNIDISKLEAIDRWVINKSVLTAQQMAKYYKEYEFGKARLVFENFFWKDFCDNYLEIVKGRLWDENKSNQTKKYSAQYAIYHTYLNILKIASPLLPHITEEMYHTKTANDHQTFSNKNTGLFALMDKNISIHNTTWPTFNKTYTLTKNETEGTNLMFDIITKTRQYKSSNNLKLSQPLQSLVVRGNNEQKKMLNPFWDDLKFITRAENISFDNKNNHFNDKTLLIKI